MPAFCGKIPDYQIFTPWAVVYGSIEGNSWPSSAC